MSLFGNYGGGNYGGYGGGGFNFRLLIGLAIAAFSVVAYLTHTSVNPVTGETQHVTMTPGQETQLGLQAAPQMEAEMGGEVPWNDPEAEEVRYVGNKVWTSSDAARSPYRFQYHLLADRKTVNAFALPGGQVFITKALYDALETEAELAGVLGHETGHVVERHSAQQVEQSQLGQRLVLATGVGDRDHPIASSVVAEAVNKVTQLHFSRADESQADDCGVRYMTEAGYDPQAMIAVMRVLLAQEHGGRQPEFLVTHPYPESRIAAITAQLAATKLPAGLTDGKRLPKD